MKYPREKVIKIVREFAQNRRQQADEEELRATERLRSDVGEVLDNGDGIREDLARASSLIRAAQGARAAGADVTGTEIVAALRRVYDIMNTNMRMIPWSVARAHKQRDRTDFERDMARQAWRLDSIADLLEACEDEFVSSAEMERLGVHRLIR